MAAICGDVPPCGASGLRCRDREPGQFPRTSPNRGHPPRSNGGQQEPLSAGPRTRFPTSLTLSKIRSSRSALMLANRVAIRERMTGVSQTAGEHPPAERVCDPLDKITPPSGTYPEFTPLAKVIRSGVCESLRYCWNPNHVPTRPKPTMTSSAM